MDVEVSIEDIYTDIKDALSDFLGEKIEDFEIQGDKFIVYLEETQ